MNVYMDSWTWNIEVRDLHLDSEQRFSLEKSLNTITALITSKKFSKKLTHTVQTNPCFRGNPTTVLGSKVKQGESVIWLLLKINLSTTTSMKRSRQELFIDMVIQTVIFEFNQITLFPCFTFITSAAQ